MFIDTTVVIGAGGSGGQLIPPLARLLAYHSNAAASLVVADGDDFEARNQTRQLCGPAHFGRNKAEVMAEHCRDLGLAFVTYSDSYIDKPALRRLLKLTTCPLVVTTVDNDATRAAVIQVMEELDHDWLHVTTGNADNSDGLNRISTSSHWHGVIDGQPFGLSPALLFDNIANPSDYAPVAGGCSAQAPSAPQLISANALSATIALLVIQNALDGHLPATTNSAFTNGRTFKLTLS